MTEPFFFFFFVLPVLIGIAGVLAAYLFRRQMRRTGTPR